MNTVTENKQILIAIEEGWSDFQICHEYLPYCIWLVMRGRIPMPIGNMVYPYRHDQLKIKGTTVNEDGKFLILNIIK